LKQTFASKPNESDNVSEMEGKRLIEKIRLRNILSFGDKGEEIELQPLNILIGQNASGKSNLVDAIKLLRSLPENNGLVNYISRNGGISEWIWKGSKAENFAEIEVVSNFELDRFYPKELLVELLKYKIKLIEVSQRLAISEETIKDENNNLIVDRHTTIRPDDSLLSNVFDRHFEIEENDIESILARDSLTRIFKGKFYTDLQTNRSSEIRKPQLPDSPNDFLNEDGSNLSLVLNDLEYRGSTKDIIVENLRKFYPRAKDYSVRILGGTVQLFIREEGLEKPISAMRLSDGTLRYLCLLAILCHPEPPPLICIEEPETGLHPDILPTIGELLIEASKRTQLIVTTHSDILVSSFSEVPEAVLVCEADEDGTHLNRLDGEKLKGWLKKYQLGDLWIRGEIGGTRW
jgi:predicted ATPase